MLSRLPLVALTGALVLAGGQAHAEKPAERVAVVTPLGAGASALTYWVDEPDGFRVVTTVDTIQPGEVGREDRHAVVRLSMERHGLRLSEVRDVAARAMRDEQIDYLDVAPWDVAKEAEDEEFKGRTLLSVFTDLPRGRVRLGASGKVMSAEQAAGVLEAGCDFVMIGRAAILHHDFPERVRSDPSYRSPPLPVTEEYLRVEGLSPAFIAYMKGWDNFVAA